MGWLDDWYLGYDKRYRIQLTLGLKVSFFPFIPTASGFTCHKCKNLFFEALYINLDFQLFSSPVLLSVPRSHIRGRNNPPQPQDGAKCTRLNKQSNLSPLNVSSRVWAGQGFNCLWESYCWKPCPEQRHSHGRTWMGSPGTQNNTATLLLQGRAVGYFLLEKYLHLWLGGSTATVQ